MTWKPDIVIYHSPCDDGFGAAWAVWKLWGDTVGYVPGTYGKPAPDVAGKHVLIVDFSFKKPVLDEMAAQAKSIVILDHHKTAEEDLRSIPALVEPGYDLESQLNVDKVVARFDMIKSGARLAWEFCHPAEEVPLLILLIEDRDLWQFRLPETKAFQPLLAVASLRLRCLVGDRA